MKKLFMLLAVLIMCASTNAQDELYLVFEMMKVDNSQESAYDETEEFWEKIHQQRANNGDIIGWDLWRLIPGGENQGYQYATVTLFSNKVAMFKGGNLLANAKAAYPNKTEDQINKKMNGAADTRDLAVRIYMEQIARTNDDFNMAVGMMVTFDWMKVDMGNYAAYEKMEKEVFQPMHQKQVDDGAKGSWGLVRFVSPIGSDTYASHMTVNMFKDVDHMFAPYDSGVELTAAQEKAINDGLKTRDMKMSNMAVLERMVRKQ